MSVCFAITLFPVSLCSMLNRVERAGGGTMRWTRMPLITPDIRNFHNLFHAAGSLRALSLPTLEPSRTGIGGAYSLQASASCSPSRTCEYINTGCILHKLKVETQARGQRLISYLDKGPGPSKFSNLLLPVDTPSCIFLWLDTSEGSLEKMLQKS